MPKDPRREHGSESEELFLEWRNPQSSSIQIPLEPLRNLPETPSPWKEDYLQFMV